MAVSVGGTQADPYRVDNWADFLTVNSSGNYVKFANPHEVNGEIVLSGTGEQTDPYIVSTYEEMLFATGATYIWEVKLIDREQKIYRYEDIYCRYDDSLSTIDFNLIQPEGYMSDLEIEAAVDANGWTWRNMTFNNNASLLFTNEVAPLNNIRIINFYAISGNTSGVIRLSDSGTQNSIWDIRIDSTTSDGVPVFQCARSDFMFGNNISMALMLRGKRISLGGESSSSSANFRNSKISLDVDTESFYMGKVVGASRYGSALTNVLVTGNIKTSLSEDVTLGEGLTNCVFDVAYVGNGKLSTSNSTIYAASFYNSDKVDDESGLANMIGATTNELKSAQYLFDNGLPIGMG